jgi:heat shock protein HslJ
MLHWSVKNVQAVWVYPQGADYRDFPQVGESSQQVCPPVTMTFEMRVLQLYGSTVFREVTISVAVPLPTATPLPTSAPDPLAGTRWEVVTYNNGQGAVVSVIVGSRISLDFGAGKQVSGNAGCNDFSAAYQVNGPAITIGRPSVTTMLCSEPEGVMDQETKFLAALQSAATFRIDGNSLEMRTAAGAIAITATRVP